MVIREASSHSDLDEVVRIQREVWGASDLDIAGRIQLKATQHAGGSVLAACDDGGEIGGFAYAFPAHDKCGAFWHSDMLAVRPTFRGRGVGQALKWAQREHALARGITRITWTFDPMQAGNAHLNLELLGVTVSDYLRNFYGVTSSALHHGLPTDRLLARWDLETPRVRALARAQTAPQSVECERCAIPRSWNDLVKNDPSEALEEQSRVAAELEAAFDRGLSIIGFDKLSSSYLLGRGEGQ
jgi:predicted GNAT superfamily acetyltransferase